MSEKIAVSNNDFELSVTPDLAPSNAIATPNGTATPITPANFGINDCKAIEDGKCKCSGDKVLVDKITEDGTLIPPVGAEANFNCMPIAVNSYAFTLAGRYQIIAGANKTKCSDKKVMLENDESTIKCKCAGTTVIGTATGTFSGSCTIKISKAGQDKAKSL